LDGAQVNRQRVDVRIRIRIRVRVRVRICIRLLAFWRTGATIVIAVKRSVAVVIRGVCAFTGLIALVVIIGDNGTTPR